MKNFVFHSICKRGIVEPPNVGRRAPFAALPLVADAQPLQRNDLLLVYRLPSLDPNAAIADVFAAKERGWNPPIDRLSFFLNRSLDVFRIDWNERRLLTRSTFDALRDFGKVALPADAAPIYSPERLDAASAEFKTSAEPFEYLAFGSLADFCAVDERRYFGARTLVVDSSSSI